MPLEALHSMFCAYMGSQRNTNMLTFWASCALHMNDTNEIIEVFNSIKEIVSIVENHFRDMICRELPKQKDIDVEEVKRLINLSDYVKQMDLTIQKENLYKMNVLQYFVISFSHKRDFLPMWNAYGDGGVGVCIKIETDNLQWNIKGYDDTKWEYLSDVVYNPKDILSDEYKTILRILEEVYLKYIIINNSIKEDNNEAFRYYIKEYVTPIMKFYNNPIKDNLANQIKYNNIPDAIDFKELAISSLKQQIVNEMILNICPLIKNPGFTYENECRLVFSIVRNYGPDMKQIIPKFVKYRVNKHKNIIPYVEIEIPIENIKEIILGPCAYSEIIQNSLNLEMDSCGFDEIPISNSKLPFRLY